MKVNIPRHVVEGSDDASDYYSEKCGGWLYASIYYSEKCGGWLYIRCPSNTILVSQQTLQWSPTSSDHPKPSLPLWCALLCSLTCSWQISSFLCSPMLSRSALGLRRRTYRGGTLFCWPRLAELKCLDRVRYTFIPGSVLQETSLFDFDH